MPSIPSSISFRSLFVFRARPFLRSRRLLCSVSPLTSYRELPQRLPATGPFLDLIDTLRSHALRVAFFSARLRPGPARTSAGLVSAIAR